VANIAFCVLLCVLLLCVFVVPINVQFVFGAKLIHCRTLTADSDGLWVY